MNKKAEKSNKVAVLITTDSTKRGVFAGFIDPADAGKEIMIVEEIRMAVYWSADVRGVVGLAATGPTKTCKITKAAGKATVHGVTAVLELSEQALKAWRQEPWG